MSSRDQAAAAALAQVAVACDGAFLGITLAVVALRTWLRYRFSSSALAKIRTAPAVRVSDLRSILSDSSDDSSDGKLVVVRGQVQAKSSVDGNWMGLRDNVLVSPESGDKAVVIQRTQTCLYNEWRGVFRWTYDLHSLFTRSWKEQESSSVRTVPFVLIDGGHWPRSGFVAVDLNGSVHPLPLTTVYHQLRPVHATPYTLLQAIFGHEYPVGLLDEEKILPIGKEITAVGICSAQDGVSEIKSCKDLPYFLCDMTKDQIVGDLAFKTKVLLWSGIFLGTFSFGILGYAIARNWSKWKEWMHQRRRIRQQSDDAPVESHPEDDAQDIPDGELCVVCLQRRRRSAFVPCGHLVCCPSCALLVERDSSPKCPVCRQTIRTSVRIYAS